MFGLFHTDEAVRTKGEMSLLLWWVLPGLVLFVVDRIGRLFIIRGRKVSRDRKTFHLFLC